MLISNSFLLKSNFLKFVNLSHTYSHTHTTPHTQHSRSRSLAHDTHTHAHKIGSLTHTQSLTTWLTSTLTYLLTCYSLTFFCAWEGCGAFACVEMKGAPRVVVLAVACGVVCSEAAWLHSHGFSLSFIFSVQCELPRCCIFSRASQKETSP